MESKDLNSGVALIELDGAPDDPATSNPAYQQELGALLHSLRSNGIGVSARYDALDGVNRGSGLSGTFVVTIPSLGSRFGALIGAWLDSRYGRRAKLRVGEIEAEADSAKELIKLAKDFQKRSQSAK
jgi:hypothetical protein